MFCESLEVGRARSKSQYFADKDGVIYRRRKNGEHQLIVPSCLSARVIALNHDPVTVIHPDRSRTIDILCLRYYWSKMRRDVEDYIKHCPECQRLRPRLELNASRLENLKSNWKLAQEMARNYARKSHVDNKRFNDRTAKEREFSDGDFVYMHSLAGKAEVSAKFRRPWTGPWRITVRKSKLNYEIMNQQGKRVVVHADRLRRTCEPVEWQEPKREKGVEKVHPKRRQTEEEEEEVQEVSSTGPIVSRAPPVDTNNQSIVVRSGTDKFCAPLLQSHRSRKRSAGLKCIRKLRYVFTRKRKYVQVSEVKYSEVKWSGPTN